MRKQLETRLSVSRGFNKELAEDNWINYLQSFQYTTTENPNVHGDPNFVPDDCEPFADCFPD